MKKYITKQELLQLIGLLSVASSQLKQMHEIEVAIADLLLVEEDICGGFGHISDAVFCDYDVGQLLKNLKIQVLKPKRRR